MYRPDLKSVALPIPEIIAIRVFGKVANLQYRERGRKESGTVPFERALVSSYRPPIVNFASIFTRFRDTAAFVLEHTTFPHLTSPKLPHVPLGLGRWPLGFEARRYCPCN